MLPWSFSFVLFSGVVCFYYGKLKQANKEKEVLIANLQKALDEVKTLSGILPICSSCKKIRDDDGYWQQIEEYIRSHSNADFTHGICNDCVEKLYPEFYPKFKEKMNKKAA
jgi:preprotein translocase subunit YajC